MQAMNAEEFRKKVIEIRSMPKGADRESESKKLIDSLKEIYDARRGQKRTCARCENTKDADEFPLFDGFDAPELENICLECGRQVLMERDPLGVIAHLIGHAMEHGGNVVIIEKCDGHGKK